MNDLFVNDRLETFLHVLQALARTGVYVAVAALAWYGVGMAVEGRRMAREGTATMVELRRAAEEQRAFLGRQNEVIDRRAGEVVDRLAGVAAQAEAIAREVRPLVPQLEATLAEVRATVTRLPEIADNVEQTTAEVATLAGDVRGYVEADQEQVLVALKTLAASGRSIEVLIDGTAPELQKAVTDLAATTSNVKVIATNMTEISNDASYVSSHWRDRIAPPPYKPTGNRFVRGLKHTGRYAWRLIRNAPEVVVVGLSLL